LKLCRQPAQGRKPRLCGYKDNC